MPQSVSLLVCLSRVEPGPEQFPSLTHREAREAAPARLLLVANIGQFCKAFHPN